jgi:hypothetical protein
MAIVGSKGDTLYRSLVVGDASIEVSVEMQPCQGSATRSINYGRCGPPSHDGGHTSDRVADLLATADDAVALITHPKGR